MKAEYLDKALRAAGVPIHGVSIGRPEDKGTWRIEFDGTATSAQRTTAQGILDGFAPPSAAQLADDLAQQETTRKELRAIALGLWECIPAPLMTKAQLAARIVAIYKTL